jgi:flavin reductase (DIM6/NTAB) family NADH-FMN oxidoreductase RutF
MPIASPLLSNRGQDATIAAVGEGRFREAMRNVPAPTCIVSTIEAGEFHGTTVSAMCSLSLRPPLILVCLNEGSGLLQRVRRTREFTVTILSSRQIEVAEYFAKPGRPLGLPAAWRKSELGAPELAGATGWLSCSLYAEAPGGDHGVLMGLVADCSTSAALPAIYYARQFCEPTEI